MGIGAVTRSANARVSGRILLSWLVTVPLGALLGAVAFAALRG